MKRKLLKKTPVLLILIVLLGTILSGCNKETADDKGEVYTATATGYGGDVTVDATVTEDGKIGSIYVNAPDETAEVGGAAATKISEEIVSKQSLSVDIITGATITCNAIITATEDALKQAGIDTEALKEN